MILSYTIQIAFCVVRSLWEASPLSKRSYHWPKISS